MINTTKALGEGFFNTLDRNFTSPQETTGQIKSACDRRRFLYCLRSTISRGPASGSFESA